MAYEQRDNSGTIFVNDRKEKDTHPDRSGTAMIDGVMYYVSGWLKQGSKGPFLSLAFKRKEDQPAQQSLGSKGRSAPTRPDPISTGRPRNNDMDDDQIPFAPEFR
jgi:hypothetical protein